MIKKSIIMSRDNQNTMAEQDMYDELAASWPSPWIARDQVGQMTGGLLCAKTMRNLDSQGVGPQRCTKIGRKVVYAVGGAGGLIDWLRTRSVTVTKR